MTKSLQAISEWTGLRWGISLSGLSKCSTYFRPNHSKVRLNQFLCHLALVPAVLYGPIGWWIASLLMFYLIHGIGSGCGAHRYFTHRSYQTSRFAQYIMAFLFTLASSGSVIGYVLIHNRHHKFSDKEGDPHNPAKIGKLKTWFGMLDKKFLTIDPRAYMRLRSDPLLRVLHDYYFLTIMAYCLIVAIFLGWQGFVFLYCLPVALQFHANSALIVLCHSPILSYRRYDNPDQSTNLYFPFRVWLLGEELHNNHHYRPNSATMNTSQTWLEADPLSLVIRHVLREKTDV